MPAQLVAKVPSLLYLKLCWHCQENIPQTGINLLSVPEAAGFGSRIRLNDGIDLPEIFLPTRQLLSFHSLRLKSAHPLLFRYCFQRVLFFFPAVLLIIEFDWHRTSFLFHPETMSLRLQPENGQFYR